VNEIFDPERVNEFYNMASATRAADIAEDKSTNYGVVRLGLLEHIYETLYTQRLEDDDEEHWQHRILAQTSVLDAEATKNGIILNTSNTKSQAEARLEVDVVIVAAGYGRDMHEWILEPSRGLMPGGGVQGQRWIVGRDYRLEFQKGSVQEDAGVWLSGCNEGTHGVSLYLYRSKHTSFAKSWCSSATPSCPYSLFAAVRWSNPSLEIGNRDAPNTC